MYTLMINNTEYNTYNDLIDAVNSLVNLYQQEWDTMQIVDDNNKIVFDAADPYNHSITDFDLMTSGTNMLDCQCYKLDDNNQLTVNCGEITSLMIDGVDQFDPSDRVYGGYTPDKITALAKKYNQFYDEYNGFSDLHILLDDVPPCGCTDCPWHDICDAVTGRADIAAMLGL